MRFVELIIFPLALLAMLCSISTGNAQEKQESYSLDDLLPGGDNFYKYYPKGLSSAFVTDGYLYYFKDKSWVRADIKTPHELVVFMDSSSFEQLSGEKTSYFSLAPYKDGKSLLLQTAKKIYLISSDGKTVFCSYDRQSGAETPHLSRVGGPMAYSYKHNIYLQEPEEKAYAITKDGNREIVYGEVPHRNEFGIDAGMYWSPSGRYLAFYKMDQSMVSDYPLVKTTKRVAEVEMIKYPMAGMPSHEVSVGIYDTRTKRTIYLNTGAPKDRYFTNLAWTPDETELWIEEVNRGQDSCALVAYSVETAEPLRVVLTETHPKYVEPQHPVVFIGDSDSDKAFLRLSRTDGYNHLSFYAQDGRLLKRLTGGKWEITDFHGVDPRARYAYFSCNKTDPRGRDVARVNIRNAKMQLLSTTPGVHRCRFSPDFSAMIDSYSSIDNPGSVDLLRLRGYGIKKETLLKAENPLPHLSTVVETRLGKIKDATDNYDLYYKICYPKNIAEGKRLPTIIYVYNGPHAQLVTDNWVGLRLGWDAYMASRGYVVFTLDGRGSANRGLDFESSIFRDLGRVEMADQMKGVEYLKTLPFVDPERIGVHGWSYGGFMTTNLLLTHPETFKVGVAGGPVMDWSRYEVMYGERYMDTPEENPIGYKASNLIRRAKDLKSRLLIIHGDQDPVVVWQHSLEFLRAAVKARTYPDYMVYPTHPHNVRGRDRVQLYYTISRYFEDHL